MWPFTSTRRPSQVEVHHHYLPGHQAPRFSDAQLRIEALSHAVRSNEATDSPEVVVNRARSYYQFLCGEAQVPPAQGIVGLSREGFQTGSGYGHGDNISDGTSDASGPHSIGLQQPPATGMQEQADEEQPSRDDPPGGPKPAVNVKG